MDKRTKDVRAFHQKYKHPVGRLPHIPSDDRMRFRLKLIREEFFELVAAVVDPSDDMAKMAIADAHGLLTDVIERAKIKVDFPELMDACGDLEFVIEGTRVEAGVDGAPIHDEIYRANMAKGNNGPNGKPVKGPEWEPPKIVEELMKQGWEGLLQNEKVI